MRKIFSILFVFFLSLTSSSKNVLENFGKLSGWKAGAAKVNITPETYIWMGGYAFREHPAEGKITDLWAKAIALEDSEGQRAVIVTMDLHRITKDISDNIRFQLKEKLKLSQSQIILNTSHTHTGPVFGNHNLFLYKLYKDSIQTQKIDEYASKTQTAIVELVIEAFNKMKPVHLYSGNGITRFQVNRHTNVESALTGTKHLNGPNDYSVPVIKIEDNDNNIVAVLFGYACHNTTLNVYKWSGDYAGFAQIELEKKYPGAIALFVQGAGGDLNPLPRGTISLAKKYGKDLAAAVEAVVCEKMKPLNNKLLVNYLEIDLPFAKSPPTKEDLIQIINDSSASAYPPYLKRGADHFLNILEEGGTLLSSYPWYPVQVWNIGGQAIFAFGGELAVGYTVDLKQIFGQDIFVFSYCNDNMSYIPTVKMLGAGGYESTMSPIFTTPYSHAIEKIIIDSAIKEAAKTGIFPITFTSLHTNK